MERSPLECYCTTFESPLLLQTARDRALQVQTPASSPTSSPVATLAWNRFFLPTPAPPPIPIWRVASAGRVEPLTIVRMRQGLGEPFGPVPELSPEFWAATSRRSCPCGPVTLRHHRASRICSV